MKDAMEVLRNRRSIRKFKPEQITREELEAVIEAGRYAPTAMNRQPGLIVAVQDADTLDRLRRINAEIWGSCWINRIRETFEREDGKALLKEWGVEGEYIGVGSCILGYPEGEHPEAKKRTSQVVLVG